MDIGIGLPSINPAATPAQLLEFARTAERRGFSSLAVIDRLVYGNTEPLVTLGAAAAVTERIKLLTSILLVPFRANGALLAKQAATVDHLSGGRLVLGMAVGGYRDDFDASGVPFEQRGRRFDAMLEDMTRIWAGESRGFAGAIGPAGPGRDQLVFGGSSAKAYARVARWGGGWIGGARGVEAFRAGAAEVRREWTEQGRDGAPRLLALPYFALGPDARRTAEAYLTDHYAIEGEAAQQLAATALTDADAVREAVAAYEQAGCDELVLFPCDPDPRQAELLADVVGLGA
ncbi:LLM class flavin-dependent oxidoreductase [Prauserella cavernicola]|uniref:LLM class flavin-dependent oxidoreductase n=1 Tax=Prauserella cavernicola TaxID=2800127 RepID=A0A934V2M7_9PSEU|nr:LLM class flavin-dependent oxidoreductase [Prauserella cavernicola]MBK1783222.1 LLM class flavin-dependent oxidoreductase [Prauserella cavernicola]